MNYVIHFQIFHTTNARVYQISRVISSLSRRQIFLEVVSRHPEMVPILTAFPVTHLFQQTRFRDPKQIFIT